MKLNDLIFYSVMIVFIFIFGGSVYTCLEILWRGFSHISMFILAGFVSIFIALLNDTAFTYEMDFRLQILISSLFCIIGEGVTGLIVNKILGLNVWCYDNLFGTFFFGQCNIFFCFAWIGICIFAIPLLDFIEYFWFNGRKPYYKIGNIIIFKEKENKL